MFAGFAFMLSLSAAIGISALIASLWNIYVSINDMIQARNAASVRNFRLSFNAILDNFARLVMLIAITGVMFLRLSDSTEPSANAFYIYSCLLLVQSLLFFSAFLKVYERFYEDQVH